MHETRAISARMDAKQAIFGLVKAIDAFELRRLDKPAFRVIRPAVIAAAQNKGRACWLLGNRVGPVAADIVKCSDNIILTQDKENWEACKLEGDVVSRLGEAAAMCNANPCLGGSDSRW